MAQKEFWSVGKQYKKIAGKRYCMPRKYKKIIKRHTAKILGLKTRRLKFNMSVFNRQKHGR